MSLLQDYLLAHTTPVCQSLNDVERFANLHTAQPQMLCGPYEGRLLTLLCQIQSPRCAVEIGSFVGYSAICIAQGLPSDGILHLFEANDEYQEVISHHLQKTNLSDRVVLHIGKAEDTFPSVFHADERSIDFAFIDAGKRSNLTFYELLMPHMRQGGLLLVDNVLWSEKVLDVLKYHDPDTLLVHDFNEYVQHDNRVDNIILNVRDGLLICRVR